MRKSIPRSELIGALLKSWSEIVFLMALRGSPTATDGPVAPVPGWLSLESAFPLALCWLRAVLCFVVHPSGKQSSY